jgi:hypothetical protein
MFRRRKKVDEGTHTAEGPATVAHRPWYGPTRALTTLLGGAAAIFLIWLATQISDETNGGYWAQYGVVAGAGLVMAFSQILGGWTKWGMPRISPTVLVIGFLPVLIVGGWIVLAHQPHSGFFRGTVLGWSSDLGIRGLVDDFRAMIPAVSFLIGLTFGYSFDTTGPRLQTVTRDVDQAVVTPPVDRRATDEPLTAERDTALHTRDGKPVRTGVTTAPPPEPAPRAVPPDDTA